MNPSTPFSISARLDRIPSNRRLWGWVARISLGGFFEVWDLALTSLMSPLLLQAGIFHKGTAGMFGLHDQASFAFMTLFGLYIGSLGFSSFADRFSRRRVFVVSMLWYAIATTAMGMQDTAWGVCLWRFVAGIGLGAEMVVIDCYLAEMSPKALRGRVFSLSKFVQMCAIPACGVFAFVAAPHNWLGVDGWRWMAYTPALGALLVLLIRQGLPESPRWLVANGQADKADHIVSALETYVTQRVGIALPLPTPTQENKQASNGTRFRDLFQPPHRQRVLMLIASGSASAIAFYGFAHWVPTMLEQQGVSVTKSMLYTGLIGVAYPLSPLLSTLFADKLERKWQIALSGVLMAVLGLVFAAQTTPAMWIVTGVLLTFCSEMQGTANHTYRSELFPTHMRAKAVGFIYSFSRMSSALSSYLIAIVLMGAGVTGVFIFMAAVMGFSVIVTLCFGPRTRGRAYEELEDPQPLSRWTRRSAARTGQHTSGKSDGPQPIQPSPH